MVDNATGHLFKTDKKVVRTVWGTRAGEKRGVGTSESKGGGKKGC